MRRINNKKKQKDTRKENKNKEKRYIIYYNKGKTNKQNRKEKKNKKREVLYSSTRKNFPLLNLNPIMYINK